jgi:hypothetical protein
LAEELSRDGGFDVVDDPLNDTGVRHLAVKVMPKKSALSRLFSRGLRRT